MKQLDITTALDLLGLALLSAGSAIGLWPFVGGFALLVSGIVLVIGSQIAART